jgi:hypothetical protein
VDSKTIIGAVQDVTSKWTKQRKQEERHAAARVRRWDVMTASRAMTVKKAAYSVMREAYLKASANNTYVAKARQIMYAARGAIQELTGKALDDRYFTQTLLPDFMAAYPELTADWKVVWDARGHLTEPHTQHSVPLGTTEVEDYIRRLGDPRWCDPSASMPAISTCGPSGRYGALLFVEKEGFGELFREAKLAERYDLAIMSTKGVSVTAARRLVDHICSRYEIPLFVLHDFDVSGFTILRTLQCDTRRYAFRNSIQVVDLGLRLADAKAWGLENEIVRHHQKLSSVRAQLEDSGATEEEIQFLKDRRVELNAFTSDKLIEWIEGKLEEHGVQKIIPGYQTLAEEYRRQHQSAYLRRHFEELLERSRQHIADIDVSAGLRDQVIRILQDQPALAWNDAIAEMARSARAPTDS